MNTLTLVLTSALLHFIWQGAIVAALLMVALFLLRNASANARYIVCCMALGVLTMLPIVTAAWLYEPAAGLSPATDAVAATSIITLSPVGAPQAFAAPLLEWIRTWTLTLWSIGVLILSIRILLGCRHIYLLRTRGAAANSDIATAVARLARRIGIDRPVKVLMSRMADGPGVVGWWRPVILLPASSIVGLTPEQLEAVIAHELAHIKRHDYRVSALQVVVETLLFYHPAVWWTSARIRHERELCCDDLAVRTCGDAICYARALTNLEKSRTAKPILVLGAADRGLLYRIQRIVGEKTMEYGPSKFSGAFVLFIAVAGLALNLHAVRAETKPIQERSEAGTVQGQERSGVNVNLGGSSVLHRTGIEYPRAAIEKGIQGTVSVEATIDSTGDVIDARVLTGPAELRRAALQSILQWHFVPESQQSTRVVHIAFDLAAAKEDMKERATGETYAYAYTAYTASEAVRGKIVELSPNNLRALEEAKAQMEKSPSENSAETRDRLEALKRREAEIAKRQQEERNNEERGKIESRVTIDNRVLQRITAYGVSDATRDQIAGRLPVRIGETLSRQMIERMAQSLRQFDEHLESRIIPLENNGAEFQIIAPGAARDIRVKIAPPKP